MVFDTVSSWRKTQATAVEIYRALATVVARISPVYVTCSMMLMMITMVRLVAHDMCWLKDGSEALKPILISRPLDTLS